MKMAPCSPEALNHDQLKMGIPFMGLRPSHNVSYDLWKVGSFVAPFLDANRAKFTSIDPKMDIPQPV
jgi:hypothetical protein